MPKFKQSLLFVLSLLISPIASIHAAERSYRSTVEVPERNPISVHIFQPLDTPKGVLVALHGCGGLISINDKNGDLLSARHAAMARFANALGWVAVFPDSFTTRGRREICTQKFEDRTIKQSDRKADVLATLQWVKEQPWFVRHSPLKTVLLGWSNGGTTVLQTIETARPQSSSHSSPDVNLQVATPISTLVSHAVAFYPGCSRQLARNYQTRVPLTLFLGGKDDWTPSEPCVALGARIDAQIYVYPDAHHGFDSPVGKVRLRTEVPNGVNPGQGVHVGPDKASREDAYLKLKALLDTLAITPLTR